MRLRILALAACASLAVVAFATSGMATSPNKTVVVYDDFSTGDNSKWSNGAFGLGELANPDANHQMTFPNGAQKVRAVPFRTGADFSVFDHLKYIEVSNSVFAAPAKGSVEFSVDITAQTPGTVTPLTQQGIYGPSGTWVTPAAPPQTPDYSANVLEGQQAGVVLNMVDFCTGQLFDWFLTSTTAFTLIERLPTSVTGNVGNLNCPGATEVGRSKMYTQIADEVKISGGPHNVAISYSAKSNTVEYRLDGKLITKVENVGIPLDKQGVKYTGIYPSLGPGESLAGKITSFAIGHGLFSLIDAFPYQHPEAPEFSVSIPVGTSSAADAGRARLFGQGADGPWDNFIVTTIHPRFGGGRPYSGASVQPARLQLAEAPQTSCETAIWSVRPGRDGFLHGVRSGLTQGSAHRPPSSLCVRVASTDTGRAGDGLQGHEQGKPHAAATRLARPVCSPYADLPLCEGPLRRAFSVQPARAGSERG
jgi:hypothetical protein